MRKLIATLVLSLIATSAFAWGPREQGVLAGIAGLWVFQQLNKAGEPVGQPQVVAPPQVIPQPTYPGYIYRPMYKAVDIFIPECNCYRTVYVQIN